MPTAERHEALAKFGLERNIPKMQSDLRRYKIEYDQWFFESTLHESGYVAETVEKLVEAGYTYEKDGALWLATSRILEENYRKAGKSEKDIAKLDLKDDVLRRANGFNTYFAADIAYHRNKFEARRFDRVINIWAPTTTATWPRLKGALDALGLDGTGRLDIVLMQLVKLMQDGAVVRMSKRTGKAISLSTCWTRCPWTPPAGSSTASPTPPWSSTWIWRCGRTARTRCTTSSTPTPGLCKLMGFLAAEGHAVPVAEAVEMDLVAGETERALMKQIAAYCEAVRLAGRDYDPQPHQPLSGGTGRGLPQVLHRLPHPREEPRLLSARLKLAACTRVVLKNGMDLLGVTAPEQMEKLTDAE